MRRALAVLMVVFAMVSSGTPEAKAGAPAKCAGEKELPVFRTGHAQGRSLINSTFESLGRECTRLSELRKLAKALRGRAPKKASLSVECRILGMHQGLEDALFDISKGCSK